MGEYANLFADRDDIDVDDYVARYGKDAVIVFGKFSGEEVADYDYGMIFYPYGETSESENAKIFLANNVDNEGNFGIAISLSGDILDSGKWSAKAFYKLKDSPLTVANCFTSDEEATFNTTTEKYDAPASIAVDALGVVTWEAVADADFYSVQIKAENATEWTVIANQTETAWSLTDYLKGLTVAELNALEDQTLAVRVGANGDEKCVSDYVVLSNVYGEVGGANYRLKVVENVDDLKAYSYITGSLEYLVFANDVIIAENTAPETFNKIGANAHDYLDTDVNTAKINALGRKLVYSYDDTNSTIASNADGRATLWDTFSGDILNLYLEANITTKIAVDSNGFGVISNTFSGTVYNSFFKVRAKTTQTVPSTSNRTRIALVQYGTSTWNNCIFDMVTYDKNDNVVVGGTGDWFDQVISGEKATINNCTYITNGASVSKSWTRTASSQTLTNSNMYASFSAFTSVYGDLTAIEKANYASAGFSVVDGYVYYNGLTIAEPSLILDAPSALAYDYSGAFNWIEVANAESYNVQVYADDSLVATEIVNTNSFSLSKWFAKLDSNTLNSLDGKKLYVCAQATANGYESSDYSSKVQVVNQNGTTTISATAIEVVSNANDLRSVIADKGFNAYIVISQDIILDENATEALLTNSGSSAYYVIAPETKGATIDFIGHTISYVINEDSNGSTHRGSLFGTVSHSTRFLNAIVKADITRPFVDGYFTSLLAFADGGVRANNCYFELNLTTTPDTDNTAYTRSTVVKQTSSTSAMFTNCMFNLRSYKSDGTLREGGDGKCEGSVGWEKGGQMTIKNCAYIKNSSKSYKKPNTTVVDSDLFTDMSAFITAWNDNTLTNKSTYVDAGWSVDGDTVKLWGTAINA